LSIPTIHAPISTGKLEIGNTFGTNSDFWKNASWLENLIKTSNRTVGHSIRIYAVSAFVIVLLAIVFVLIPRFKQTHTADPE
jgi:hypothetical protein